MMDQTDVESLSQEDLKILHEQQETDKKKFYTDIAKELALDKLKKQQDYIFRSLDIIRLASISLVSVFFLMLKLINTDFFGCISFFASAITVLALLLPYVYSTFFIDANLVETDIPTAITTNGKEAELYIRKNSVLSICRWKKVQVSYKLLGAALSIMILTLIFLLYSEMTHISKENDAKQSNNYIFLPNSDIRYISGNNVRMRANENKKSKILHHLNQGALVTVLEQKGEWTNINIQSNNGLIEGWVYTDYVGRLYTPIYNSSSEP